MEITCRLYRPRKPRESPLFQLVERHLEELLRVWPERFTRHRGALRLAVARLVGFAYRAGQAMYAPGEENVYRWPTSFILRPGESRGFALQAEQSEMDDEAGRLTMIPYASVPGLDSTYVLPLVPSQSAWWGRLPAGQWQQGRENIALLDVGFVAQGVP